jgi:hypothetical protein
MMDTADLLRQGLYKLSKNNIYRYRDFQRGIEMLDKQELYLSSPEGFNDPFDCYEGLIKFKMTKEFMRNYITKNAALTRKSSREQRRRIEKQYLENPQSLNIEGFFKSQRKQFGVCCFSWDYKSIVMWAHYADNHGGICLGFKNLYPVQEGLYGIYPVDYVSEIEQYQFTSYEDTKYWQHWLCTKSIVWNYEQEVRIISKSYNGKLKFPKEAISEIFLGLSTLEEDEQKIIDLLVTHNYPKDIKLYKMAIDKKTFSLLPIERQWKK